MFIQSEATPKPATLKFLPGQPVMPHGTLDIKDSGSAGRSPLARALFTIEGVSGVFLGPDFISVTKSGDDDWRTLKPMVLGAILEHYTSGAPMLKDEAAADVDDEFFEAKDADTVETIKELLESRVRPAVAGDGGDITFRGFRDGIVYLEMKGSCSGCPSSTATLKNGVQNLLKHYVPEVSAVEQI